MRFYKLHFKENAIINDFLKLLTFFFSFTSDIKFVNEVIDFEINPENSEEFENICTNCNEIRMFHEPAKTDISVNKFNNN